MLLWLYKQPERTEPIFDKASSINHVPLKITAIIPSALQSIANRLIEAPPKVNILGQFSAKTDSYSHTRVSY